MAAALRWSAMRIGVFGAGGRMGAEVCRAVVGDPDLELVAAVDPGCPGRESIPGGVPIAATAEVLEEADAEVAVDFTELAGARENLAWCASHGVHAVVGTTGFTEDDMGELGRLFPLAGGVGCFIAPNFAIGAVLMMRFAELAAPWFDSAEVIELHHDGKIDAPSGTAVATARRMAEASGEWGPDPTKTEVLPGARGGLGPAGIRIHSVRLRGLVAHQAVLLGTNGQSLTIRHDSYDRSSFMPGVLLAVKSVAEHPGVTVGLDRLLGL
ncbi:MAG: 4-hydroxy-tetrahydrodipicolinate reductase [Actinomycetota bacterium]|nr:4-hydroxy-tetrahydrodipicolinate reductase [Actinomycetota bacterium]MDQ6948549.1 4-hydroxy-tetrahydrodipicolinate reductase [Actinomycetota bacterium]